jgi:hypothetical protein
MARPINDWESGLVKWTVGGQLTESAPVFVLRGGASPARVSASDSG